MPVRNSPRGWYPAQACHAHAPINGAKNVGATVIFTFRFPVSLSTRPGDSAALTDTCIPAMTSICLPMTTARAQRMRLRPFRTFRKFLTLLSATPLLATAPLSAAEASLSGVSAETLVKSTAAWDQTGYTAYPSGVPAPTLVRLSIAPNTQLDWHVHPMPAIGYVRSGQLTVERADNGTQRTFTAGQTIMELVDVPHRGRTGDAGVELLVFYAGTAQQPLSVPAPDADSIALDVPG
ncbi:hypothetical protein PEP31012_04530 [Pandoraea eparura]|jgi:quercetin dioxygenase-like cupin family protein|uniref:Cupin type-2 domain-containing protein n=2 Tax=Pandoraea eparura TaxID=2508291 RepID=A0A5E4YG65_9BURK|nr:hypothetical protein PEP31012_04530 [Pandoraea eparura]